MDNMTYRFKSIVWLNQCDIDSTHLCCLCMKKYTGKYIEKVVTSDRHIDRMMVNYICNNCVKSKEWQNELSTLYEIKYVL